MNLLPFLRTATFVALVLALCLWVADSTSGFGPGGKTPTVGHDRALTRSPDLGTSPSGHRLGRSPGLSATPSSPRPGNTPSGAPGSGVSQPSPGFGIGITPQILIPRGRTPLPPEEISEPEDPGITIEDAPEQFAPRVEKPLPFKLAKPRVPYLSELAMDIEQSLMELVRRDPAKAVRIYEQELKKAKRVKDTKRENEASTDLGHVCYLTGRLAQAEEHYSRSVDIWRRESNFVGEGIALRNLGATLTASGEYRRAEEHNLAALGKFKSAAHVEEAQMTLNNLGVLEKNRGRYRDAADYYEQALEIVGDPSKLRALVLRNLGNFRKLWGEYERAVDNYTAYGNLAASLGRDGEAAEAFLDIGSIYERQGSYDRALATFQQAVQIQSTAKIDADWSKKLMGDLLLEMNRPAEAEPYIIEAGYDSSTGLLHLVKSQPQTAKKHYDRLLDAATREMNLDEMFTAHTGLGKAYEAMQNYAKAQHHYTKAVGITEEIRASLLLSERRNFFAEKVNGFARSEPAKGLARVALKQNNPAASIYAGEVTKAREFADNLSQKTEGRYFDVPPELLEKEAQLTNKLAALKIALNAVPKALDNRRFAEIVSQIKQQDSRLKAFVRTLCENFKEYGSVKYPRPVGVRDSLINDAEYVLLFDVLGDSVGTTLLKGKRVVRASLTPWQTEELEKQVRRLRAPFEKVQLTKFSPELAGTLYQRLLAEALKSIPGGSSITVIPDGPLALLPFEALVVGGVPIWKQSPQGDYPSGLTYVADLYSITYYQSIMAMTLVRTLGRHKRDRNQMLVMADPVFESTDERLLGRAGQITQPQESKEKPRLQHALDMGTLRGFSLRRLPESERLGKSLKGLIGASCQLYTGLECTKPTFLNKFGQEINPFSAVVFGTHGFAANDLPGIMEPALALTMVPQGTDGFLTMSEVAGLRMDVDIAALTACKTGLGMRLAGEGVMSMGRAFQSAGARSVIMSLWSVAERPSILLMEEFFKELIHGRDKLTAWGNARAHIRKEGFEHPFFWASFILVGEAN